MKTINAETDCCGGCGDNMGCESMAIIQDGVVMVVCDDCTSVLKEVMDEIGEPEDFTDIILEGVKYTPNTCPVCSEDMNERITIENNGSKIVVCGECGGRVENLLNNMREEIRVVKITAEGNADFEKKK